MTGSTPALEEPRRPVPRPDDLTRGFWEAATSGTLAIQHCWECDRFQHPPRPQCHACGAPTSAFAPVSGHGTLWSWTTTNQRVVAGLEEAVPYTCLVVELAEQPGLFVVSDLIGRGELLARLRVDMPMRVVFGDGDVPLPQFEPAELEGGA